MDLTELYKRLGQMINIREKVRKEIISFQTGSARASDRSKQRIQALEEEYDRVQQQVIEIDREIRICESAGVSL